MHLKFNSERCTGCQLCTLACSGWHLEIFNPRLSHLKIKFLYHDEGLIIDGKVCDGCDECINVCPSEAISRENGILTLNRDLCTSCQLCMQSCPQGVIFMWEDYPRFCNMCKECINICPKEALTEVT